MKLAEVQIRAGDKVPSGAVGNYTSRLMVAPGPGPSQGWALDADYDKRCVFATKGDDRLVLPFESVAYMKPEPPAAKAKKDAA